MFVWQRQIVDASGNVLDDASVEVRDAATNELSEIFEDLAGTTPKSNPFLVDDEGFARFYAAAGLYDITATRSGLEKVYADVLLGVRLVDVPDLTDVVTPIVNGILAPAIEDFNEALAALPDLVRFTVLGSGDGVSLDAGWSSERLGQGHYRVTHGLSTLNYHPKFTVWDPNSDRVFSAMLTAKEINFFEYRVRSIHDEASDTDARVDIEVTVD